MRSLACRTFPLFPPKPTLTPTNAALFTSAAASRDIVGLIAAVIVTNSNIAAYVWMAFTEEDEAGPAPARPGKAHAS